MFSGLLPATDIRQRGWHVGSVPEAVVRPHSLADRNGALVIRHTVKAARSLCQPHFRVAAAQAIQKKSGVEIL
jgi:hypothetical protein